MNSLRLEADEAVAKVEELQTKVKALEQENLSKEQDITSLQHKNNLLETEVEKLETLVKDFKKTADEGQQHGTQNETLQRRLQLLEEEAEGADKTLRETNEKYVLTCFRGVANRSFRIPMSEPDANNKFATGSDKPMSRLDTSSARSRPSKASATSGSRSTRRWLRSTLLSRRSWRTSSRRLATSRRHEDSLLWIACVGLHGSIGGSTGIGLVSLPSLIDARN